MAATVYLVRMNNPSPPLAVSSSIVVVVRVPEEGALVFVGDDDDWYSGLLVGEEVVVEEYLEGEVDLLGGPVVLVPVVPRVDLDGDLTGEPLLLPGLSIFGPRSTGWDAEDEIFLLFTSDNGPFPC